MKRLFEPVAGIILSYASWQEWTNLLVSLFVAFLGGALAYLGKWMATMIVQILVKKKDRVNITAFGVKNRRKGEEPSDHLID